MQSNEKSGWMNEKTTGKSTYPEKTYLPRAAINHFTPHQVKHGYARNAGRL
jgi:hypothetical protein